MRLKITLYHGWEKRDADSRVVYLRQGSDNPFQVSWGEYKGAKQLPKMDGARLRDFAVSMVAGGESVTCIDRSFGACRFGQYGLAIFRTGQSARFQIWVLSDGINQILATHDCRDEPSAEEVREAHEIALGLWLGD